MHALPALVAALLAQSATSPTPLLLPRDSQALLRAAHRAQGEFELTRRWHLPGDAWIAGQRAASVGAAAM